MNLREAFDATPRMRSGRRCTACVVIAEMTDDDRDTMSALLNDPSVSVMTIVRACQKAGYSRIGEGTLKRHRRGECVGLS
jgi:DNA-binding MurR/RpiR family transcriptional regulator